MHEFTALDGALLIDKPAGPTSHDVVDKIRRKFGIKKVGHCGTLDPNATGLLIIVLGRGTKLSERLMSDDKVYEGTIKFGEATDSYDCDGQVTETKPVPPLTLEQLNEACTPFIGDIMQTPPMVSAIKKNGVPLYKLARKGVEVEREARLVHVYNFRFT
jgi:tRNA pseudouridine55 synthase